MSLLKVSLTTLFDRLQTHRRADQDVGSLGQPDLFIDDLRAFFSDLRTANDTMRDRPRRAAGERPVRPPND